MFAELFRRPCGIYVALCCTRSPRWGRVVASMGYARRDHLTK